MLLEADEAETLEILNYFESQGFIRKTSHGQYVFVKDRKAEQINSANTKPKNEGSEENKFDEKIEIGEFPDIKQFIDPVKQKSEYEKYLKAPENARKKADKYLLLFNAANGYRGKVLQEFLAEWSKKYPHLKVAYSTFQRNKNNYRRYGISALLPKYHNPKKCPGNAYLMFRKLYLNPEKLSAKYCAKLIKKEIPSSSNGYSLLRRLRQEFSQAEINNYRVFNHEIPEFIKKMEIKHDEDNV